ncbi:hypothetical protein CCR95_15545 [Thiocystis minor]|uniref:methyl-accepting chemotaxis protein n=1 Tax=Thiocystis minor TaxID=61597 RepID=UPI001911FEB1|nr:methyl-accepting chemotaxis protein [Thiocystis minor]MBK5965463.1 hypothetical protein [Thiocystis minor]
MTVGSFLTSPAEHLLARLRLSGKIALMGAAFLAVIALLSVLFIQAQRDTIRFSSLERDGVALLRPVPEVMLQVQRHRGLMARLGSGDDSVRGALADAQAKADAAFEMAAPLMATQGLELGVASDWNALKERWNTIKGTHATAMTADSFRTHSELLEAMLAYVSRVADQSNLTLDPDIDSFYLMDAAVVQLPNMVEISAILRGLAAGIAVRQTVSVDERIQLAGRMTLLRWHAKALAAGLAKITEANPAAAARLQDQRNEVEHHAKVFSEMLDRHFVNGTIAGLDGETVFASGTRLVEAGHRLWGIGMEELDETIAHRVKGMERRLWTVCGLVGAALIVVAYLFIALRGAVSRAATAISDGAQRIAAGDLASEVRCDTNDEFGAIARRLNQMRAMLRDSIENEREAARTNLRIRHALDNVTIPVTVSDERNALVYLNQTGQALWHGMAPEIARKRPGFDANQLLGGRLSDYFEDEETRAAYRVELSGSRTLDTILGGRHLRVTASPVLEDSGAYHGRVTQWQDRTAEVTAEREIAGLVEAAGAGDLSRRIALAGKDGFFLPLAEGLNRLMDIVAGGLAEVAHVLNAIAQGDLTQMIDADYAGTFGQLKDDTNTTVEHLREVIGRILDASEAIGSAASEIAAGNADLSGRTEEQAASLEETASSMEQLNATVRQNALNANQANQLVQNANAVATRGGEMVHQVVGTMGAIQESSKKIADIISVIDGIAFQTNILALNAAVEAARAGEQGRGFAVVAAEVRNLAQRSAQAAKEIKGLITDSVAQVEGGAQLATQSGATMHEIVTGFRQVVTLVDEITQASHEQSTGIEQVTQAVTQMDEVTQQNAALVEEAAAAAESLEDQTRGLSQAVAMFKLAGQYAPPPAARAAKPAKHEASRGAFLATSVNTRHAPRQPVAAMADDEDQWEAF